MSDVFDKGRDFVRREGRVLERRLFAAVFENGPPGGVIAALRAYQNDDGGFGHGLEPDKLCPDSQPLDVEIAFETMEAAGAHDDAMVRGACAWLDQVATPDGAVPWAFPSVTAWPRASHWTDGGPPPGLNPTATIAGYATAFGVDNPWVERATSWCWGQLDGEIPGEAHTLRCVTRFLDRVPDRERAASAAPRIGERLITAEWFRADPDSPEYGLTPFDFAPTPDSPWLPYFDGDAVDRYLDRLERDQQPDGGWPITWEPPSEAATLAWRASETIKALETLSAYGRINR